MIEELEKTYLAKYLPQDLEKSPSEEIVDIYISRNKIPPRLRIRRRGEKFEITKKGPKKEGDASHLIEDTIKIEKEEFNELYKLCNKIVTKTRYRYKYNNKTAEFDIFQKGLEGLVLVDIEFETIKEKDNFKIPNFCLDDVTQEDFIAGGMLAGRSYKDIEKDLLRFNYSSLYLK